MKTKSIEPWRHDHTFGQDLPKAGERRSIVVIIITLITMFAEIAAGAYFGSMALLADGLHMGSHASALTIAAFAYYYTRKHAADRRFSFGVGKVNSLAAFASAMMLLSFAGVMAWESSRRLAYPTSIAFNQAIFVAILGLIVNGVCLVILGGHGESRHDHNHEHIEEHEHEHVQDGEDHNLLAAYFHVLADALTSVLAIFALLAGKYLGQVWLDPVMGIAGAILIARWSVGLMRISSRILLDEQAPEDLRKKLRDAIEAQETDKVYDLHVWSVGPGVFAAEIAIVSTAPQDPDLYRKRIPADILLHHVTIEVQDFHSPPDGNGIHS